MSMLDEFKTFAIKGNAMDMAVGIIIGAAFGKIVASLVADVIMPPIGLAIGGVQFTELALTLQAADGANPAVTVNYGNFLQTMMDFVIIAFVVFLLVKTLNNLKKREEVKPSTPTPPSREEVLLTEIRDLLKSR